MTAGQFTVLMIGVLIGTLVSAIGAILLRAPPGSYWFTVVGPFGAAAAGVGLAMLVRRGRSLIRANGKRPDEVKQ